MYVFVSFRVKNLPDGIREQAEAKVSGGGQQSHMVLDGTTYYGNELTGMITCTMENPRLEDVQIAISKYWAGKSMEPDLIEIFETTAGNGPKCGVYTRTKSTTRAHVDKYFQDSEPYGGEMIWRIQVWCDGDKFQKGWDMYEEIRSGGLEPTKSWDL